MYEELSKEEAAYWSVNSVMKKRDDMVRTCQGIGDLSWHDVQQILVHNLFDKSIPKWDDSKEVNFTTYLYTCTNNKLMNLTDHYCRKKRREKGMWSLWVSVESYKSDDGVDRTYLREENYRDLPTIANIIMDMDLSDMEIAILKGTLARKKFKDIVKGAPCSYATSYREKLALFKRIRVQYKVEEEW